MKKIWTWSCLTAAGVLAMMLGSRLKEAVALDADNMGAR